MNNIEAGLVLNSIPELGNRRFKLLVDEFGNCTNIFERTEEELLKIESISRKIIFKIQRSRITDKIKKVLDDSQEKNIKILVYGDKNYPENLSELYAPPSILFSNRFFDEQDENSIAIVGSRFASKYAKNITKKLTYELVECGFTIISGFAKGIDIEAHYNAVKNNGRTVCVFANGIKVVYPSENMSFYKNNQNNEKVIFVSEYFPYEKPVKQNFPARNRIISGLSKGTIVVQAGKKSGALITANMAVEQNREVFVVPDRIDTEQSYGSNELIKKGQGKLIQNVDDILNELQIKSNVLSKRNTDNLLKKQYSLTDLEQKILNVLSREPISITLISEKVGLTERNVNVVLTKLELNNLVCQMPGYLYVKV
jgi:DNA processing protein